MHKSSYFEMFFFILKEMLFFIGDGICSILALQQVETVFECTKQNKETS